MTGTVIVGFGWYSEEEWAMLKLSADDPEELDETYERWRAGAEKAFQQLNSQSGIKVVKVPVDVQSLRQWCERRGALLNGGARAQYIAEIVRNMPSHSGHDAPPQSR